MSEERHEKNVLFCFVFFVAANSDSEGLIRLRIQSLIKAFAVRLKIRWLVPDIGICTCNKGSYQIT